MCKCVSLRVCVCICMFKLFNLLRTAGAAKYAKQKFALAILKT